MQVGLKIWRYDSKTGDRALQGVRGRRARGGDAARLPRPRQGQARRLARLPQELPDDDLRLVRDADGRRRRARLQGAHVRHRAGGPRARDLRDGEPPDRQGPRRRHGAVLAEDARRRPVPAAALRPGAGARERRHRRRRWTSSTRSRSASTAAAASPSATRWSPTRTSSARPRSPRGCGSSATRATAPRSSGSRSYSEAHGLWDCTRCYFCNERCPKGVDPRDAIAKLGAEAMKNGIDRDMGAKHAKWFVTSAKTTGWLRETELVPKTQGIVSSIKEMKFAMGLAVKGKVPPPFPPHVAAEVHESRALFDLVKTQGRDGAAGIVQGEKALGRLESHHDAAEGRDPYDRAGFGAAPVPAQRARRDRGGHDVKKLAYYKGCLASLSAKELDISTQALAPKVGYELIELESVTCCGAGDIHEAEPDYYLHLNARILAYAEATGCDTLMTVCNVCTLNLRQANHQLTDRRRPPRARQRQPRAGRRAPLPGHGRGEALPLADRRRVVRRRCRRSPTRASRASRSRRSTAARSCARRS